MGGEDKIAVNNILSYFDQILAFAKSYGLPLAKKRAVLREYLQVKILELLFREKKAVGLCFVGGTALRLLYELNRFSEDLDFDLIDLNRKQTDDLVKKVFGNLQKQGLSLDFYRNVSKKKIFYEFRFKDLLFDLGISKNANEKLAIKLDFEDFWRGHKKQAVLLNRYGFLANVMTIDLNQQLVQKLYAYLKRAETQPRDIYDIVWLIAQKAVIDKSFFRKNKMPSNLIDKALKKFRKEKRRLTGFQTKLKPFLSDASEAEKILFFPEMVKIFGK